MKLKADMDWEKVDLKIRAIFVRARDAKYPIGGRHRLQEAMNQKEKTIPAISLTQEEYDAIKIMI